MTINIIKEIPFKPDPDSLLDELRIRDKNGLVKEFYKLFQEAESIARPKALYRKSTIQYRGEDFVVIDGVRFDSRILSVNLKETNVVFSAVATCGTELDSWAKGKTNILHNFWADSIKDLGLTIAANEIQKCLKGEFKTEFVSLMTPGSLDDWPLSEQKKLFNLLGNSTDEIGVVLTDNCFMLPLKTVSCLVFPSDEQFFSCQLCSREKCPKRRAPYEDHLLEKKYEKNTCDKVE